MIYPQGPMATKNYKQNRKKLFEMIRKEKEEAKLYKDSAKLKEIKDKEYILKQMEKQQEIEEELQMEKLKLEQNRAI